jgi:hypothetical protein
VLQVELGCGRVIDDHASLLQQRHLLGMGGGGLAEGALHRCHDMLPARSRAEETRRTKK